MGLHINGACLVILSSRKFQSLFVTQDQSRCDSELVLIKKGATRNSAIHLLHNVQEKAKRLRSSVCDRNL